MYFSKLGKQVHLRSYLKYVYIDGIIRGKNKDKNLMRSILIC